MHCIYEGQEFGGTEMGESRSENVQNTLHLNQVSIAMNIQKMAQ